MVHINPYHKRFINTPEPTVAPTFAAGSQSAAVPIYGNGGKDFSPNEFNPNNDKDLAGAEEKVAAEAKANADNVSEVSALKDAAAEYLKAHGLDEVHNLKDVSQMTLEEMKEELKSYGVNAGVEKESVIKAELQNAREERAVYDKGSDVVDGHIGTFVQGQSLYCSVLAHLDNMSDEEMQSMVQTKTDTNGQKIYVVTFPSDRCTEGNSVEVTEAELRSGEITVTEESGEQRTLNDFPKGDADVTMITMAFVKRFGTKISDKGAWIYNTENRFAKPGTQPFKDNQFLEDVTDYSTLVGRSINFLNSDELRRKGNDVKSSLENEDLSWIKDNTHRRMVQRSEGFVTTLSDGRKACIARHGILLSDGTKIENFHAMAIKGYDAQTKELIISGSEFNNMTQVRVPVELLQFMETGAPEGFPGVDRTPLPDDE